MRIRLAALIAELVPAEWLFEVLHALRLKQGVQVRSLGGRRALETFYNDAETRDVLDSVTTVYDFLKEKRGQYLAWRTHAAKILSEEHLSYKVNSLGIVQPFVDVEFERNRSSAIEALGDQRFDEARADFEAAYANLRDGNGKVALRMMFPAVEVTAKVLFPGKFAALGPSEVDRHIAPQMRARYIGNQPAIDAGNQLLSGMKNWINAAQPYRHGQEIERAAEPPRDLVITHLSTGASYLRWMIELCSAQETDPS